MEARVYPNKFGGAFETGFDVTDKDCEVQRQKRAERFGMADNSTASDDFPVSLDELPTELPAGSGEVRSDALFVFGVDDMSTSDIMAVFQVYAPKHLEWINDSSCVVTWTEDLSAKRALFAIGKWPYPTCAPSRSEGAISMNSSVMADSACRDSSPESSHDSGIAAEDDSERHAWRVAQQPAKAKYLLLRLATQGDRKKRGAARESKYYVKYGNPHTGQRGAVSLDDLRTRARKRRHEAGEDEPEPPPRARPRPTPPRPEAKAPSERLTITIEGGLDSSVPFKNKQAEEMDVDEDDELQPRRMASTVVAVKPIVAPSADMKHRMRLYSDDPTFSHGVQPMEVDGGLSVTVENTAMGNFGGVGSPDLRARLGKRDSTKSSSRLQIEKSPDGRSISVKRRPNKATGLVVEVL